MVDGAICRSRHRGGEDGVAQRGFADQHVIGGVAPALAVDAEPGRGIALRIEIDDQHPLADGGERGAEIDRRRGLADAALLVGDRQHPRQAGLVGPLDRERHDLARIGIGHGVAFHAVWGWFGRRRSSRTTRMRPSGLVLLGTSEAYDIPIFRGFGQFGLYILALRKQGLCTPSGCRLSQKRRDPAAQDRERRQRPCGDDVGAGRVGQEVLDPGADGRPPERRSGARPRAGTPPSCRCFRPDARPCRAGRRARRRSPDPGNPAPEPRSIQMRASGASGSS